MKGVHALEQRKQRIQDCLVIIAKAEMITEPKLLAKISIRLGITKKVAKEYLDMLVEVGSIKVTNGVYELANRGEV